MVGGQLSPTLQSTLDHCPRNPWLKAEFHVSAPLPFPGRSSTHRQDLDSAHPTKPNRIIPGHDQSLQTLRPTKRPPLPAATFTVVYPPRSLGSSELRQAVFVPPFALSIVVILPSSPGS